MCEPSPGVGPGLLPGHPRIAMALLSPGSLFAVHVTPQVPSSEVGQAWAAEGACQAVTSRWVSAASCGRLEAALWLQLCSGGEAPAPLSGPVTGLASAGKWGREIKFLF